MSERFRALLDEWKTVGAGELTGRAWNAAGGRWTLTIKPVPDRRPP